MEGSIKNHIKVWRAKKNMTQADLAKAIGSSRQAVNAIEKGKYVPSTLLALKMAEAFTTTVEEIFEIEQ
ncbi:putative transcriptional regulator [Psychroflexus salarius]|uniref:Putative transcriptional regulator n=1 Tax=Psychroflexus salarius TaxID=1155689 RepID=A0A1M4U5B4_9FLAO|nr:helix-turn-helix transcriptional regulator [Psychroflexus salarius]SHE51727.1 putative transcriptional regulator [Psychroflexus salarius]